MKNLFLWTAVFVIAVSRTPYVQSGFIGQAKFEPRLIGRCRDIPEAVSTLHHYLPEQMLLTRRCKRYAALSAFVKENGIPQRLDVLKLSELKEDALEIIRRKVDARDLMAFYMTAIDGYRVSHLEPSIFDVVKCLKEINLPEVTTYLDCPELVLTLNLYRYVLDRPDNKIRLDLINLRRYSPAFVTILKLLFKDYIQSDDSPKIVPVPQVASPSRSELPSQRQQQEQIEDQKERQVKILFEEDISQLDMRQRYERRRQQQRQRQKKYRLENPHRHREQERLRKRRNRILNPAVAREKGRIWEQKRRDRLREQHKQRQKQILDEQATITPHRDSPEPAPITTSPHPSTTMAQIQSSSIISTVGETMQRDPSGKPHEQHDADQRDSSRSRHAPNVMSADESYTPVHDSLVFAHQSHAQQVSATPMTSLQPGPARHENLQMMDQHALIEPFSYDRAQDAQVDPINQSLTQGYGESDLRNIWQPYEFITGGDLEDDSLMSLLATFDPQSQPGQLDDIDAVMQSFSGSQAGGSSSSEIATSEHSGASKSRR